jgi:beta-lactamase superfamily II metal-dependent hydrolase
MEGSEMGDIVVTFKDTDQLTKSDWENREFKVSALVESLTKAQTGSSCVIQWDNSTPTGLLVGNVSPSQEDLVVFELKKLDYVQEALLNNS